MPDWRHNVLSTSEAYLPPAREPPPPAASYPRRAARARPPTCPYTTIFLGARAPNRPPPPDPADTYGDVYSVDRSSNLTDTSSFAHYEDCRPQIQEEEDDPLEENHKFPAEDLEDGRVILQVQKVPYTSSVFYVTAKNGSVQTEGTPISDMYVVEGDSEESDALSSCTCDSFERCEFDCRDFEPFSDTCCCDPLSDGVCTRSPKEVDSPEQYCEEAEEDAASTRSDMEGLDLALFEPAPEPGPPGDHGDHGDHGEPAPRRALCGLLYALPDTATEPGVAVVAGAGAAGAAGAGAPGWEPFYCVLQQERRLLTAYTSEELAVSNNNGDYSSRSLPRVRLDAGSPCNANAGVRLRCWAAPPSITEEEAEDEIDDDAASLRALPTQAMPLEKDDGATPPSTPPMKRKRKRRRRRSPSTSSSSSSSEERAPRKVRKYSSRLTTEDVLKLLADFKGESSKSSSFSNNLNNVVPEFDPSNRAQTIEGWLKKVNECATIYAWDEKQIVHFSLQKLTGLAKRWFETLPSVVYSWSEWQIKLQKAFPSEENYGRLLEEMLSRTSRNDESLREYYYDKLSLLNRCEISGKKAVDCIVHGLSEGSIKSGAQTLDCREPEGLLNFLCSQRSQSLNQNENRNYSRGNQRTINRNRNDANQSNRNNNVNCFNCRSKGHPYYKCPKPLIKCKRCYRIGHDSDDCKLTPLQRSQAHEDTTSERKTLKIDVSNKANDKFFKVIPVNNKTFEAYIDFGSECSLIRQTDANALQLTKNYDGLPVVRGFGNSSIHPLYKSHVTIKIDEVDASIEILVISDEIMPTSIIVGQNFTELPFITVLKNSDRLTFYKSPSCNPFTSETDEAPLKLYIAEPTEVTETSIVTVQAGDSTYTGDVYIEGYCSVVSGREFGLFQGAYHLANGKGNLIITNLASGAVKFDTGTLIARAVPFLERDSCQMNRIVTNAADLEPLKREDVKIGEGLETEIVDRLYSLLQDYRDCFATNLNEIGCVKDVEMHIELLDNRPVVYRPYRLSHLEREKVRETIDELLRNDIIQESSSSYSSPILMVKKKTGEQRLCVDFRALNNKTCKDRFPLPIIDDQISNLSGNTYFTTLDLASGYYQVPMAKDSQHLTGFVTPDGHYEFKRMPFGLANAPAVFQRMINKILGNKRFEYALAYLDDVLIPSKNADEMFQRLEDVLKLFRQFGLTLKLSKCRFFTTKVEYLGYEVSSEGIQPGKAKVAAVEEFPTPRNIHEVRQFLGLTGYYRKFIQGYGEIARPLTYLLKKDSAWQWSHEQDKAFVVLKEKLVSRPVLALYDPKLETELHTDASSLGVGGILMQWQKETRVLKPVAYFSRQTTAEEKHLHSYELEALAVVCSLKKFRVYLLGLHFKVYTDCAALRTTLTKRDLVPRIARWWLQISEFSFEIEYRPGVQMTHVDALSRNATLTAGSDDNPCVNIYNIEQDNWLLTLQLADPDIARVFKILKPEEDEECKDIKKNYHVKNRTVYRKVEDSLRLVVPRNARWQICKANHDEMGHPGYSKTLERIQKEYWFPKLRRFVKKYVDACIECAYNKDNASRQKTGHLFPIEKISVPFHTIHIDHLGPFVKSKTGNTHILTIVDGFTKYVFVRAVKDTKTKSTIKVLQSIFYDFGIPARIISDRGTSFTSTAFKDFCSENGIKHVLNAVACPRANGQAERYNQIVLNSLATQNCNSHERDWDKQLGKIQWGINNTVSSTTQKTPTEALFGVRMRDNLSNKLEIGTENDNDSLQTIREEISSNIAKDQEKQKSRHNSKRAPAVTYKVGDLVKISRNNYGNDGKSTKLLSKFIGPFRISEVLGNDRYRVTEVPGFPKRGKAYDSVIAVDRIRPWIHIKALEIHDSDHSSSNNSEDSD